MSEGTQRRLAAIVAIDVVGYSRLMGADEAGTLARLKQHRAATDPIGEKHGGRIVGTAGDGLLMEFPSVVAAVQCTIEMQTAMAERNADISDADKMLYRIGVNIGDVLIDGDDIYGDGVNVAARLETLAEPGGITLSDDAHRQVRDRLEIAWHDSGEHQLKNIARPIHVWRWSPGGQPIAAPAAPLPDKPSIAVLPFDNMSNDPEQEYFSDGIAEDIITDLSKVSGLFVIARNSSFAYKGQNIDLRRVCTELGVRHVLEGSVRKAGNRVRINAQLIDGASGGHLWAERYDRDLEDIFAVQDEVTREIVNALKVALTAGEQSRREDRGKINAEAYDCMVRARKFIYQFSDLAMHEGRALLKRAIALEPSLAPAYAMLAMIHALEYVNEWNDAGPGSLREASRLADKAIAADENEPQAYHARALTQMWLGDLEFAEQAAERAIELDPNYAGAFTALGTIRDYAGRSESAIDVLQQALRLDPHYHMAQQFFARAQFSLRRYAEAEASFERRLVQSPRSDMARMYLASIYGHTRRPEEARRIWRELLEINPDFSLEHQRRTLPYQDPAWFEHLLAGLHQAGLPEG